MPSNKKGLKKILNKVRNYKVKRLNLKDGLLLGLLQGLAVVPGISRSGITVSAFF